MIVSDLHPGALAVVLRVTLAIIGIPEAQPPRRGGVVRHFSWMRDDGDPDLLDVLRPAGNDLATRLVQRVGDENFERHPWGFTIRHRRGDKVAEFMSRVLDEILTLAEFTRDRQVHH